jgi:hypothetical protein
MHRLMNPTPAHKICSHHFHESPYLAHKSTMMMMKALLSFPFSNLPGNKSKVMPLPPSGSVDLKSCLPLPELDTDCADDESCAADATTTTSDLPASSSNKSKKPNVKHEAAIPFSNSCWAPENDAVLVDWGVHRHPRQDPIGPKKKNQRVVHTDWVPTNDPVFGELASGVFIQQHQQQAPIGTKKHKGDRELDATPIPSSILLLQLQMDSSNSSIGTSVAVDNSGSTDDCLSLDDDDDDDELLCNEEACDDDDDDYYLECDAADNEEKEDEQDNHSQRPHPGLLSDSHVTDNCWKAQDDGPLAAVAAGFTHSSFWATKTFFSSLYMSSSPKKAPFGSHHW